MQELHSTDSTQKGEVLLRVDSIFKDYFLDGKKIEVLRGISFEVSHGEMISLIGPSGVGKSTLLHIVGTIDRPTKGKVFFEDEDVFRFSEKKLASFRNRTIGFVFQFHHLMPEFTALENVMMPALIAGMFPNRASELAAEMLNRVGLGHRLEHIPGELSGGEQQRVAIARALVMNPKLLLADEPTGNLDERTASEIHELLFELNEEYGITFIVATHNSELANKLPRKWEMQEGKIVHDVMNK